MENICHSKNPKVGIASIICMIISFVILVLGFILIIISIANFNYGLSLFGGILILIIIPVSLGGIVTGIIGCCSSPQYKKTLSIIGLSMNAVLLLMVIVIMIIGSVN